MIPELPTQDLDCPDPDGCPVAIDKLAVIMEAGSLTTAQLSQNQRWHRVYDARDGHSRPNAGYGDTRFAPFDARRSGERVPTLYIAQSLEAALLETSLHDIHATTPRVVAEMALLGKLHAHLFPPRDLFLIDLRDDQLSQLGLMRGEVSSSPAEHYPCTRLIARELHARSDQVDGIIWHSRQAELTMEAAAEVAVVFCDRVSTDRQSWRLAEHRGASGSLLEGSGRLVLEELAEKLDITISVDSHLDGES